MKPSPLEIDTNNSDNNEYQLANTVSPTNNEETPPSTPFHLLDEEGKNEVSRNSSSMSIRSSTNDDENENSYQLASGTTRAGNSLPSSSSPSSSYAYTNTVTILYMSVFAVLGSLLRIVLAQLFGEECKNPGTVGWLKSEAALCVTASGQFIREGGIIYSDIPSNILGSFLMGFFLNGSALGLPTDIPFAAIPAQSMFQKMSILHTAIRTGFCGSLTTYSSWNSEMVIMMYGTGSSVNSQIMRALFGYVIGLELALSSFTAGKNLAIVLHRKFNSAIAREADAISQDKNDPSSSLCINKVLPGFERRFLASIIDEQELDAANPETIGYLDAWKVSTEGQRENGGDQIDTIYEIERLILVDGFVKEEKEKNLKQHHYDAITEFGWDIRALEKFKRQKDFESSGSVVNYWHVEELMYAVPIFLLTILLLIFGVAYNNDSNNQFSVTYRSMCYSALWAPPGALLRWKLSGLNGKLDGSLSWVPFGTLLANTLGSIVSISMIATEMSSRMILSSSFFYGQGTLSAVKVGFAGSLSTVSTFIKETSSLMAAFPRNYNGYTYMITSLSLSCFCGVSVYGWIVYF